MRAADIFQRPKKKFREAAGTFAKRIGFTPLCRSFARAEP
jgi:hypothetical protein